MADMTQAGANFVGTLTDMERKQEAYNALSKAYGPAVAYDPQNALAAAQSSAQMPLAPAAAKTAQGTAEANLTGKQLENTDAAGQQQRLAGFRAAQILKNMADPQTGAVPADAYDKFVRPNAGVLGIDAAHVDQFGHLLSQPGGAQHLDNISQALIGPTKITGNMTMGLDANGQPVAIVKDQYGNIRQQSLGGTTTVQQQNANTGKVNAGTKGFVAQTGRMNAGTMAQRERVYQANQPFAPENPVSGGAPAPGGSAPAAGAAPAAGGSPLGNSVFARLPMKGRASAISQATQIVNQGTNLSTTNQVLDTVMRQISPYTAGSGNLLKNLPGTAQADLKANLATLKAQGLTSWIASLKNQSGSTGIGRVLQSEANAAMNLYGNMEQDQSAKQLAFHATLFKKTVNRLYEHSNQAFTAMYGVKPHEAIGADDPDANATPFSPQQIVDELRRRGKIK